MSPSLSSTCARCGGSMSEGFLLDQTQTYAVGRWVEGAPVRSIWTGIKLKGRKRVPIQAFRCERCGALDLRAPTAS